MDFLLCICNAIPYSVKGHFPYFVKLHAADEEWQEQSMKLILLTLFF